MDRSRAELERAAYARRLVKEGRISPIDALDLASKPTDKLRALEQKYPRTTGRRMADP